MLNLGVTDYYTTFYKVGAFNCLYFLSGVQGGFTLYFNLLLIGQSFFSGKLLRKGKISMMNILS